MGSPPGGLAYFDLNLSAVKVRQHLGLDRACRGCHVKKGPLEGGPFSR